MADVAEGAAFMHRLSKVQTSHQQLGEQLKSLEEAFQQVGRGWMACQTFL